MSHESSPKALLRRFLLQFLLWTGGLAVFLLVTGWGGESPWATSARIPGLLGFAMVLACFPAALSVGARALSSPAAALRNGLALTGAGLVVMVGVLVVNQVVAPRALASGRAGIGVAARYVRD